MATMYMLHGFFGSGKSTWAKNFAKEHPDTKIVSGDGFRTMLNGEYKYIVELDEIITESMRVTICNLLWCGWNVIVDVGNLSKERRSSWMSILVEKRIAVVFPQKSDEWHINNRLKNPHWEDVDWQKIRKSELASYEPISKEDFDEVINIEEWEGN